MNEVDIKNDIVIIHDYKETSTVDIQQTIETAFKIFYDLQMRANKV